MSRQKLSPRSTFSDMLYKAIRKTPLTVYYIVYTINIKMNSYTMKTNYKIVNMENTNNTKW